MLFKGLYQRIFINIVIGESSSTVYVEIDSKEKKQDIYSEIFSTATIDTKMYEYINSFVLKSPFHYISILDNSLNQGAIPTCKKKDMINYFDIDSSKYICYKNRWASYSSKSELVSLEKTYLAVGLDFIFSPVTILSRFFKEKVSTTLALYMLIQEHAITIAVYDNAHLLYAEHIKTQSTKIEESLLHDEDSENTDDLEIDLDLDLDLNIEESADLDDIEDFGDIEDLDTFDDIDEFSEEQGIEEIKDDTTEYDLAGFKRDFNRFTLVQDSINNYYKDSKYESKFLEKIYIADGVGSGAELKRYFEDEMFLKVLVRRIDLGAEICDIAKAEIL